MAEFGINRYVVFNRLYKNIMSQLLFEKAEETIPSIDVLYDYVKTKEVKPFPVKYLLHELKPTPWETGDENPTTDEFKERALKADLKYPIIIFNDGKTYHIMDGVHRLWKAVNSGHKTINAYILTHEEAKQFKWKDHNGVIVDFTEEWDDVRE